MDSGHIRESRGEKRRRWEGILSDQEASGLSAAAFCRERGLSYQTFGYWKKRLRPAHSSPSSSSSSPSLFPLSSVASQSGFREVCGFAQPAVEAFPRCLEIVLGGIVVRVPPRFEESDLRRVLSLVAGVSC